jgi:hypothetical protein
MGIPENQLATWSNVGASDGSKKTYASIKAALEPVKWPPAFTPSIYLQGSYANDTNIRGDSDVDVVVHFENCIHSDLTALPQDQQTAYHDVYKTAGYQWDEMHRDTLKALQAYYKKRPDGTERATGGRKAIAVETPYLKADVIVCTTFRRYTRFISLGNETYDPGVWLYVPSENRAITNFPKFHIDNGQAKNSQVRTKGCFKPAVRMFKNAFGRMVADGIVPDDAAFSYAIECFTYSAPDACFSTDLGETFCAVVNWANAGNLNAIRRVSERGTIVGTGPDQWKPESANVFADGLVTLWNTWT